MENTVESLGPKERTKQPTINVKVKWVGGHLLVNFRYQEDEIYHSVKEFLKVLEDKILNLESE